MGKDTAPRLFLGRPDEINAALGKNLIRRKDIRDFERDEAPDQFAAFLIGRIYTLEGELALTGCQLCPAPLITSVRHGHLKRLGVKVDRAFPVGDENPHGEEFIVHVASGVCLINLKPETRNLLLKLHPHHFRRIARANRVEFVLVQSKRFHVTAHQAHCFHRIGEERFTRITR